MAVDEEEEHRTQIGGCGLKQSSFVRRGSNEEEWILLLSYIFYSKRK